MHKKDYYLNLRKQYLPKKLKCIVIAESPPDSGKYFYDISGRIKEPLFSAFMKVLGINPNTNKEGLEIFQNKGFYLIDATYKQVNKYKNSKRNKMILDSFPDLLKDLKNLKAKKVPILLVKTNIFKLLSTRLTDNGFNILNDNFSIPFPSHSHQIKFYQLVSFLLIKNNIINNNGKKANKKRKNESDI